MKSCSIDSRNEQSPTCEVVHETKFTSEISCPTDSFLAQLAEYQSDDRIFRENVDHTVLIFFHHLFTKIARHYFLFRSF